MPFSIDSPKDLAHRLQGWVAENRTLLIFLLIGGVGFFSLLAGINAWRQAQETKALELYYLAKEDPTSLKALVQDYPTTPSGLLALIDLAYQAVEQKNWVDCRRAFETLYNQATRQPFFRLLALHGQGSCLRGQGEFLPAAQLFERAAKEPGHVEPLASLFEAARCYQMAGDQAQAEERWQALLKEENLSPELKEKILEELLWVQQQKNG